MILDQFTYHYAQDLQWLEEYIAFRCEEVFGVAPGENAAREPLTQPTWMSPSHDKKTDTQIWQNFTVAECVVILTALANHIYPQVWDSFEAAIDNYVSSKPQTKHFGLVQPVASPYLQATLGTLLFLLGDTTIEAQASFWELFTPNAPLRTTDLMEWPTNNDIPTLNFIPRLSPSFLQQLLTGQPPHPQYAPDFPATPLTTTKTWDDLILGERTALLVTQTRKWVQHYAQVSQQLGVHQGQGYRLMMSGPSGSGKTMAAALLGRDAGKPVYRIDISNIVDKYVGETSKKLRRIFEVAEAQDWILFFDEGDALFGKRSEGGQSSNERYANQEVSYLLYKMEEYQGMIFLATNNRHAIDSAFKRRFDSLIRFDYPDDYTRQQLWKHFFEKPGYLQLDPAITQANWRELAANGKVSAAWIEKFYAYCVMQTTHTGDTYISAKDMQQYLYWFGCEHGFFEKDTRYLFQKSYQH